MEEKIEENKQENKQENNKPKKNNWTEAKIEAATKKINKEIYAKNRQAPISLKLDDLSILINTKITRRGIAKGLVSIQEDLNKNILEVEKLTLKSYISKNPKEQYEHLLKAKYIMKIDMWTDIRFLMINKGITPGEITDLIRRQMEIDKDLDKWIAALEKAISAL